MEPGKVLGGAGPKAKASPKKVWIDGELVDFASAKIHVLSHSLHYGVGAFEGIRAYETSEGGAVFRLRDHLNRLFESARVYYMPIPLSMAEVEQGVIEAQMANGILPSYIRPIVYRGDPVLGVKNTEGKVSVAIGVIPASQYLGPESQRGVRAKISPFRKPRSDGIPSFTKMTGNYVSGYFAGVEAHLDGYDEAILLDGNGFVAEGTGENVFLVRDGTLYTPGLESDILLGITRDTVIQIAKEMGISVVERLISVNELLGADEAFFSGTYAEIAPIREIGHISVGDACPGPITKEIMARYSRIVRGGDPSHRSWLTPLRSNTKKVAPTTA